MSAGENPILRLLASIADGEEIDWTEAERECRAQEQHGLLASLRVVAGVSEFHSKPADPPEILRPGDRSGHLVVRERIGAGAWGQVYRAEDTTLRRDVALKIVEPSILNRPAAGGAEAADAAGIQGGDRGGYLEEARRLARVRHPNVVTIHSIEEIADARATRRAALVLEYIPGRSLAQILSADGPRGAAEVIAIGVELCRALAAVHEAGLVHRDLKAQNVMRESGGRIVLMDFGPAGATPLYMAPELFRGAPPTVRTDLYALGVLLYHLATGSFPVAGADLEGLREAHARGRRIRLRDARPGLPAPLVHEIERALAPDPSDRPATAGEMERSLAACLQGASTAGSVPDAIEANQSGRGRRIRILVGTGAAIALSVAAILVLTHRDRALPWRAAPETEELTAPVGGSAPILSYSIEAGLWSGRGQRSGLREGAQVAPGDSISLSLQASRDLYVYVINEDETGESYLLFPSPDFEPANPLAAGTRHLLPGTRGGRDVYWQVTSPGERERLLIVASPRRLPALEEAASSLKRPLKDQPVQYARLELETVTQELRGLGGWVAAEDRTDRAAGTRGLFEIAERLGEGREEVRGVWIRRLDLANPGRPGPSD